MSSTAMKEHQQEHNYLCCVSCILQSKFTPEKSICTRVYLHSF